jgi:hypothetical protein
LWGRGLVAVPPQSGRHPPPARVGPLPHCDSVSDLSARFGVRLAIIQGWARKGTVKPVAGGGGPSKLFWFRLDDKTTKAIEAAKADLYKNLTPNQRRLLFAQEVHCE